MKSLLESIDSGQYPEAYKQSLTLMNNKRNSEEAFKVGMKALYKIIAIKNEHISDKVTYDLFQAWLKYCLTFEQTLISRHSIIHYAIIYIKNLLSEKMHEFALAIISQIDKFYTLYNPQTQEADGKKFIKHIGVVCHNESIRLLCSRDEQLVIVSLQLEAFSIGFHTKLKFSLNYINELLTMYQNQYVKLFNQTYKPSKKDQEEAFKNLLVNFYKEILDSKRWEKASEIYDTYANDFNLTILMNTMNFVFSNNISESVKSTITDAYLLHFGSQTPAKVPSRKLAATQSAKAITPKPSTRKYSIAEFEQVESVLAKILEYASQFGITRFQLSETPDTSSPASSPLTPSLKSSKSSKDAAKFEQILSQSLANIMCNVTQASLFALQTYMTLFELFFATFSLAGLTEPTSYSKSMVKESLLSLISEAVCMHARIVGTYYRQSQSESLNKENNASTESPLKVKPTSKDPNSESQFKHSKVIFYKPLTEFYNIEKIYEACFRLNNAAKQSHSRFTIDMCERILTAHTEYIKWMAQLESNIQTDELWKFYHNLESCCIKISSHFFADEMINESIKFQKVSFDISILKLDSMFGANRESASDTNMYKNIFFIVENLLLSLRMKEKYQEAVEVLNKLNDFFTRNSLDFKQYESVVINWCKVKRDLSKTMSKEATPSKKSSSFNEKLKYSAINRYLEIRPENVYMYLFEELRQLRQFCLLDSTIHMGDEIQTVLEEIESLLAKETSEKVLVEKCRFFIEVAQFNLEPRKKEPVAKSPKSIICKLSSKECLFDAENMMRMHKCSSAKASNCFTCFTFRLIEFHISVFHMLINYASSRNQMCSSLREVIRGRLKQKEQATTEVLTNIDNLNTQSSIKYLLCPEIEQNEDEDFGSSSSDDKRFLFQNLVEQLDSSFKKLEAIVGDKNVATHFFKESLVPMRKQFYAQVDLLAYFYGFFCIPTRKCGILKIKYDLLRKEVEVNKEFDALMLTQNILNLMKSYLGLYQFKQFEEVIAFLMPNLKGLGEIGADEVESELGGIEKHRFFHQKNEALATFYLILAHYFLLKQNYEMCVRIICKKVSNAPVLNGRQTAYYYEMKFYLKYLLFILSTTNSGQLDSTTKQLIGNEETPLSILEECYLSVFSVARFYLQSSMEPIRYLTPAGQAASNSNEADSQFSFFNIGNAECYRILSENLDIMQLLCKYYVELSRYREATCFIREGLDLTQLHFCKRRLTQFLLHQINTDLVASNLNEAFQRLDIVEKLLKNKSNKSSAYSLSLLINDDIIQIKNYMHYNLLKILNFIKQGNFSECLNLFETHILKLNDILTKKSIQSSSTASSTTSQALSPASSPSIVSLASKYLSLRGSSTIPSLQASNSLFNELFIEIYLHLCNAAKLHSTNLAASSALVPTSASMKLKTKDLNTLLSSLRQLLIDSKTTTLLYEKWYLAEYYCLLYENSTRLGKNLSHLNMAYDLIKLNPHPYLYRRICIHMFNSLMNGDESSESGESSDFGDIYFSPNQPSDYTKVAYLLETQSIALRHKACAIQIKNKRKNVIDAKLYEQLNSLLAFNVNLKKFYNSYLNDHLPNDWTVISIILLDNFDMYLVRLEKNYEPYLLKIKFDPNLIKIFKEIIHDNDVSMKQSERAKFWSTRSQINARLIQFLSDLDENVFSFARIFLLGTYKSAHQLIIDKEIQVFCDKFKLLFTSTAANSSGVAKTRKATSASATSQLQPLTKLQKQIIHLLFNSIELNSPVTLMEAFNYAKFSTKQCEQFTDYFLKNESQLLVKFSAFERKHVCLLIDKSLHQIPWECLPTLKQQTITRMPSIHFLLAHLKTCAATINKQNAFYIVDPGGDLVHTKEKFQSFFQSQKSWEGIIGVAPDESQYKKALTEYQLFIYTGHGSGSQYYPSEDVQKIRVQACSILMGCSSGNQYVMGDFEPYGTILAYILAGCPCVVGNLWDVTDRDIDRLTEDFLQAWLNTPDQNKPSNNICIHLNKARSTCKMSHLNGSAPVIYGLPVYFK